MAASSGNKKTEKDGYTVTIIKLGIQTCYMVKKAFFFIYLLGVILICTFRTPVKYYQYYDRWIVIHTHIFSDQGRILAGQWVLYMFIWSAVVFLSYQMVVFFTKKH